MGLKNIIYLLLFFLLSLNTYSQDNSFLRTKIIAQQQDTIFLDTLVLIPSSIVISTNGGEKLDTSLYIVNASDSYILFKNPLAIDGFPISIRYKVFPFDLKAEYYHKKWELQPKLNNEEKEFYSYYHHQLKANNRGFLGLSDFQKSGSISRAISVGNSQNTSVISNMNLQIAGKISDDLELIASISDDNIPIQPDGNTQQLQDFDKIFIQVKHKLGQITVGDFEMNRPKSDFLNY